MGETSTAFLVVVLLLLALVAIAALFLMYVQVRSQHTQLQTQYMGLQSEINAHARDQFTAWRDQEIEAIRQQLGKAEQEKAFAAAERWFTENEKRIRSEAIRQSTSVVTGKVTEHLTPYIGRFPYNPKDVRFLGAPIDLIIFDGMSEGNLQQIVFLEIKTGTGSLSTRERRIKEIVTGKRIMWEEFHIPTG